MTRRSASCWCAGSSTVRSARCSVCTETARLRASQCLRSLAAVWRRAARQTKCGASARRLTQSSCSICSFASAFVRISKRRWSAATKRARRSCARLFFDYHEDEEAWKHGDAYLFGPDILVSPVTEAGCTSKAVYLPKGADWREVETGKVYAGGQTVNCETPLCVMPVFVREGAELDWTLLKRR